MGKENQPARGTHGLLSVEGKISRDSQRQSAIEGHSQTVEHRGKDESGQRRKASKRRALTYCGAQREGQVRTAKEI